MHNAQATLATRRTWFADDGAKLQVLRNAQQRRAEYVLLPPHERRNIRAQVEANVARLDVSDPRGFIELVMHELGEPAPAPAPIPLRLEVGMRAGGTYAAIEMPPSAADPLMFGGGLTIGAMLFGAALGPALLAGVIGGAIVRNAQAR